jgi:hypothetical protein
MYLGFDDHQGAFARLAGLLARGSGGGGGRGFLVGGRRIFDRVDDATGGNGNSCAREKFAGLVLVDLHGASPSEVCAAASAAG